MILRMSFLPIFLLFCAVLLGMVALPELLHHKSRDFKPEMSWNPAEKVFLQRSERKEAYPGEHIPVIETGNVCELGKLTALSFLLWVKDHPEGVIALPSGKTPELFIEYLKYYKQNWNDPEVRGHLHQYGLNSDAFPLTKRLKFVQLDEFYPINVEQKNSFTAYVKEHYLDLFEIAPENVLGMDLCARGVLKEKGYQTVFPGGQVDFTVLDRQPETEIAQWQKDALEEANEYCKSYEETIRKWGGIGFFLGGIGPDGHVAFNMQGSPLDSKTRLVQLNYPSAASAAGDLGGIEYSRGKTAITVGLDTITFNKDAVVIIMAAGEAKAPIVANAITGKQHPKFPATALQGINGARFYLTKGAASQLYARCIDEVEKKDWKEISPDEVDDIVIEIALKEKKRIVDLEKSDFSSHGRSAILIKKFPGNLRDLQRGVQDRLMSKIENGTHLSEDICVLHTGPHHDDIMLSYHSLMRQLLEHNKNHFAYLTSGFNSVTNSYMVGTLNAIPEEDLESYASAIFEEEYGSSLLRFIEAARKQDNTEMKEAESVIMLKNVAGIFRADNLTALREKVQWLKEEYFPKRHPGEKDIPEVQVLKGSMRESESERMLLIAGVTLPQIYHLRTKFYTGDLFDPMPTFEKDAKPFQELCERIAPKIITVAFDPEGTGPDTHYKVLQVVAQALRIGNPDPSLKVWGYRNIWHRFKLSEASLIAPISQAEMDSMSDCFLTCFSTQKNASFPAPDHDGPFSELAEKIQRDQYDQLKILLGDNYFLNHPNLSIRQARGFILIKEMSRDEFVESARELKSRIELI